MLCFFSKYGLGLGLDAFCDKVANNSSNCTGISRRKGLFERCSLVFSLLSTHIYHTFVGPRHAPCFIRGVSMWQEVE